MQITEQSVSGVRAERDRRIIQETAALLSADYPLDQLIERLCDSLAAALHASVAYVALPGNDKTVRLSYFNDHGTKKRPADFVIPRGSHTHNVFINGYPILKTDESEWAKNERFALNPENPETDDSVSAIWVPIKYADEVLGVLSVQSTQTGAYDQEDVKLLDAVARYLAIAVRNQRSLRLSTRPFVRVFGAGTALVLIASVITILLVIFAVFRTQQMVASADAMQAAQANRVADGLENYVVDAQQLANSAAALVAPIRGNRSDVERVLRAIVSSASTDAIYGSGAWYEPNTFGPGMKYFGPYVHRVLSAPRESVLTYQWTTPQYDFPKKPWYLTGKNATGSVAFTEPYFDTDYVYFTAVKAFYDTHRRFAGVVTVDMVMSLLSKYLSSQSDIPNTVVYVLTDKGQPFLYPERNALFAYARGRGLHPKTILNLPRSILTGAIDASYGDNRKEISVPVAYTNWSVVVSSNRMALGNQLNALRSGVMLSVALLWLATVLAIVAVRRGRAQHLRTLDLEMAQVELHTEIATRIEAEERLRERAYHDSLTGLPNRAFLLKQLEGAIAHAIVDPSFTFAVLFVDLDRFNLVNDSLGHVVGDRLLAALGRRLESRLHANDIVARVGGDEFVVLVQSLGTDADASVIANRLSDCLIEPFHLDEHEVYMTASVGIALSRPGYERPEDLLRDADIAMYHAKKAGRAGHQLFDSAMHDHTVRQMQLETDLRRALVRDELFLEYQPIVALRDERVIGFEALVRWQHPTRGVVAPDEFIPLAEQTRLIIPLTSFVLDQAAKQAALWIRHRPDIYVLVNISAVRFTKTGFAEEVAAVLRNAGIPPSALKLEITESAVMENADIAQKILGELRDAGVRSQIDDFGTGYSSLSRLQSLPIDGLKIDRSFVGAMTENPEAAEIVRAIVSLAQSLNLQIIAEGIETLEQAKQLFQFGVRYGQGYYFAKPGHPASVGSVLERALTVD